MGAVRYKLRILDDFVYLFLNKVGFRLAEKREVFDNNEIVFVGNYYDSLAEIKPLGMQEVYDLTIDSEEHAFVVRGFIVHNTHGPWVEIPRDKMDYYLSEAKKYSGGNKIRYYSFNCLARGTLLLTEEGFKRVEDLVLGDRVQTPEGFSSMKDIVMSKAPVYEIRTALGYKLQVTEEHRTRILNSAGKIELKQTKDISVGDFLELKASNLYGSVSFSSLGYLAGLFIGNGTFWSEEGRASIFIEKTKSDLLDLIREALDSVGWEHFICDMEENEPPEKLKIWNIVLMDEAVSYLKSVFGEFKPTRWTGLMLSQSTSWQASFVRGMFDVNAEFRGDSLFFCKITYSIF